METTIGYVGIAFAVRDRTLTRLSALKTQESFKAGSLRTPAARPWGSVHEPVHSVS